MTEMLKFKYDIKPLKTIYLLLTQTEIFLNCYYEQYKGTADKPHTHTHEAENLLKKLKN